MGYNIEISIDLLKHTNVSETKREIIDFASDLECSYYYILYDYEERIKFPRNHMIIVINFANENDSNNCLFNCAKFLCLIKKMKDLHIECIYDDEIVCNLLYASQYYLTTIEKDKVIKYNKNKRERSLSDNDKMILEPVLKKIF
jgi:hypothetical protein